MPAIAGLRGTGDWGTDERPKNFREFIMWRNPNGSAPLFALMSRVQKESVDDPEFSWWDEPNDLVRLQVNGAVGAGIVNIVVDSGDPTAGTPGSVYGTALNLKPGDLLFVEPAVDAVSFVHEILRVNAVSSATQFSVTRGAAGTTPASIADDQFLLLIGSAYAEGTAEPKSTSRNPIKYFNYTQIFKDAYEITRTAEGTKARTGDPVKNDKRRKTWDHSRAMELAFMFGQRSESTGDNGKPLRTTAGLRQQIAGATTKLLGASWTLNDLLDNVTPIFDFDTEAGDQRIVFTGNAALNAFNKRVHAQTGAVQLQYMGTAKQFGMNFAEYRIPQGTFFIKTHPLMNRHTLYRNSWFVVDFSAIRYRPFVGADTKSMDNIQAKGEDLRRGQWLTEAGIEVRHGGLTCGYIGGFNL